MQLTFTVRADNSPDYIRNLADNLKRLFDYARPWVVTVAADHTITASNEFVVVDASGDDVVVTLPAAKDFARDTVTVVRSDASGNTLTLEAAAGETVNGASTTTIGGAYASLRLVSTGVEWIGV
ncbi:hypothetical protein V5G24_23005 [Xanthobacter sp. VTT E-85241]|uniref:hypothetical protein n=1 Tax=Roseixanthobacter finlandensis TaxID=3119922 RepID=UPI003726AB5B